MRRSLPPAALPALCLALCAAFLPACPAFSQNTADTHADAKTKALYAFIARLKSRPDHRILSGQNVNVRGNSHITNDDELLLDLKQRTGHLPAIVGADYNDSGNYGRANSVLQHYAETEGCLVSICGGLRNPGIDQGDFAKLLPGGEKRREWVDEMNMMAAQLRYFQDRGTTVLFRPFHEMNGSWCWYYAKDPETFRKAWIDLFDYLTNVKGLHNLIWLYSPNNAIKPGTGEYTRNYPGAAYVDIVGADVYSDSMAISDYDTLKALGKPIFYTEFGPSGPTGPGPLNGTFNYALLAEKIRSTYPEVVGWLSWHDWKMSDGKTWSYKSIAKNDASKVFNDPWVLDAHALPTYSRKAASR